MPNTVVNAIYNFRDVRDKDTVGEMAGSIGCGVGRGVRGGMRGREKRSSGGASDMVKETKLSTSASRRYTLLSDGFSRC